MGMLVVFSVYLPPCFCEIFSIFCVAHQYRSKIFQKVIHQGKAQLKYDCKVILYLWKIMEKNKVYLRIW